jgi:predicted nucleic acid-binding protein
MQITRTNDVACLVDTDVLIDHIRHREYALRLIKTWSDKGLVAISTISQLEIYRGMREREEELTSLFLDGLVSIPVDAVIARKAGKMVGIFRPRGVTVGIADSIIAATAIDFEVPLVTNNVNHYPFGNLRVIRGLP